MADNPRYGPNIFDFATSELSQDAFVAWFLSWGDPKYSAIDLPLHQLSQQFIRSVCMSCGIRAPQDISRVDARRQWNRLDVLAEVEGVGIASDVEGVVIAIESKTDTSHHSNQLSRYSEILDAKYPRFAKAKAYLKTGNLCAADKFSDEWAVVGRNDLLELLRQSTNTSSDQILHDFTRYLETIENETQLFTCQIPQEWGKRAWEGFFARLEDQLKGGWGYVANPSGGFMGFWWGFCPVAGGEVYLQIQEERLVIKVRPTSAEPRMLRDMWSKRVISEVSALSFGRPRRLSVGKQITVAECTDYLSMNERGWVDVDQTLTRLTAVTREIESLA